MATTRSASPPGNITYVPNQVASAAPAVAQASPPSLNTLVERWDDVVERLRASGRATVASAFSRALPVAVTAAGVVSIQLDDTADSGFELLEKAVEAASRDMVTAIGDVAGTVTRVVLRRPAGAAEAPAASRRMTAETIRGERMESLRRSDSVLATAIEELDLELLD
jgi:hypothetical protein